MSDSVKLLVVDDDIVDAEFVCRAFKRLRISNPITVAADGVEALAILRGDGDTPAMARPYLILLDLNMPRMGGIEFLGELRSDPELRDSIVFVLTTSDDERDIVASYDRNVAGYLVKSRVGEDFMELVELLGLYWRLVEFPAGHCERTAATSKP